MKHVSFEIVIEREDATDAGYLAYCPSLPGCYSNGRTVEEARKNIRNAIALHVETLGRNGEVVPIEDSRLHMEKLTFIVPE